MGSLGFGEIALILLVALLVFGPKKLPEIGRTVGRAVREFRRATREITSSFDDIMTDDEETIRERNKDTQ